jgi:hypothetical protein
LAGGLLLPPPLATFKNAGVELKLLNNVKAKEKYFDDGERSMRKFIASCGLISYQEPRFQYFILSRSSRGL